MTAELKDTVIFITGSGRGIGEATARLAAERGATVVLNDRAGSESLKQLAQELNATFVIADVGDRVAVDRAVEEIIAQHGRIDILINNAGITLPKSFLESTEADWLDVYRVNVLGTVNCSQAVIPHMQGQGAGRIVNIASIRAYGITASRPAYSASKAAIINLTATMAKEFAPTIAVNAVAPGFTKTEMSQTWPDNLWESLKQSPLGRAAEPNEIAEAILFLASDRASYLLGQTILVDGGYSVGGK